MAFGCFWFCGSPSDKSRRSFFKETANDSPSPGGEGRGEGGCHPCIHDAMAAPEKSGFMPCYPLKTLENHKKRFLRFYRSPKHAAINWMTIDRINNEITP